MRPTAAPCCRTCAAARLLTDGAAWANVVHGGALRAQGMVSFAEVLNAQQIEAIRLYVIKRANEDKALGVH